MPLKCLFYNQSMAFLYAKSMQIKRVTKINFVTLSFSVENSGIEPLTF